MRKWLALCLLPRPFHPVASHHHQHPGGDGIRRKKVGRNSFRTSLPHSSAILRLPRESKERKGRKGQRQTHRPGPSLAALSAHNPAGPIHCHSRTPRNSIRLEPAISAVRQEFIPPAPRAVAKSKPQSLPRTFHPIGIDPSPLSYRSRSSLR